jgi:hypothetical protein
MSWLNDRRVLAGLGGAVVLVAAVGAASFLSRSPRTADTGPPANTTDSSNITGSAAGGLKVEMGKAPKVESDTSVRCFVKGQFVGMQSAADCAQKNGVAPGGLDVGLDQSGAIAAAAGGGDTHLQPLANSVGEDRDDADDSRDDDSDSRSDQMASADPTAPGVRGYADAPPAECRRYVAGAWRAGGAPVSLDSCVHVLFDGRCPPPGQVIYGRWGGLTLRSSPGRIDASTNNRDFSALAPQYPADCSIPAL